MFILCSKVALIVILIFSFLIFSQSKIYALNEISLRSEAINPGSLLYIFKRAWEKSLHFILFPTQAKINYDINLLEVRMSELDNVVKNKNLNEFQQASERFSYQAGILVDQVISSNYSDKQKIKEQFSKYAKLLDKLRDLNPANSSYWLLIQQNIDTLKILTDRLSNK